MTLRLAALAALALGALEIAGPAVAEPSHGLSAFGDLKYPADFTDFDWVDPDAPKGGQLSTIGTLALTTFDSLNQHILKGDPVQGTELVFDTLMARAGDEPDAMYGLLAEWADVADDGMAVTFGLRPEARFHDGSPVTAADVVFSFQALKEKGHPSYAIRLKDVTGAEALDERTVRFTFTGTTVRDLPLIVAGLPVFSAAWWEGRDFAEGTLDLILGSGPYRFGDFAPGQYMVYERVADYWGRDLPVNRGRFNFDRVRYEYFRDREAGFEAFKAGQYDLREEFTSRVWATGYDFPAVTDGLVLRATLPDDNPSCTQGWFLNTRKDKFADPQVRRALDEAFDYEWTNKALFYGAYRRTVGFFDNSPMRAEGLPGEAELALLEPYRDRLPDAVFGEPYVSPVSDASGRNRTGLRAAAQRLESAGWTVGADGVRVNAAGERLEIEFLTIDPTFDRIIGPYVEHLRRIGIDAGIRRIDPAQYQRRVEEFDFDIVASRFSLDNTPGPGLRTYFSSAAADAPGSSNLAGIRSDVVDGLVETAVAAASREELYTAIRALDRVLRAGHYWVPNWCKGSHTVAWWDRFGRPETSPTFGRGMMDTRGIIDTWWWDADKAAALDAARGG